MDDYVQPGLGGAWLAGGTAKPLLIPQDGQTFNPPGSYLYLKHIYYIIYKANDYKAFMANSLLNKNWLAKADYDKNTESQVTSLMMQEGFGRLGIEFELADWSGLQ